MRHHVRGLIYVLAVVAFPVRIAVAGPDECRDAMERYVTAVSDLNYALRGYASCVAESRGHDRCSLEFSRLRSAQDDFDAAVSNYIGECG
jgi:hypothetical protein